MPSKKKYCKTAKIFDSVWSRVLTQTIARELPLSVRILTWLSTLQTLLCKEVPGMDSTGESLDTRHTSVGTEGPRSWPPRLSLCLFLSLKVTGNTEILNCCEGKLLSTEKAWQGLLGHGSVVHEPQGQAQGPNTRQAGQTEE